MSDLGSSDTSRCCRRRRACWRSARIPTTSSSAAAATLAKWAAAGAEIAPLRPHRRLEGHLGRDRRPRRARRAASRGAGAGGHGARAAAVHFLGLVDGELESGSRPAVPSVEVIRRVRPTSCSATIRGSATASTPITVHAGWLTVDGDRRGPRPALLPRSRRATTDPSRLLLFEADGRRPRRGRRPAYVDTQDRGVARATESQWRSTMGIDPVDPDRRALAARIRAEAESAATGVARRPGARRGVQADRAALAGGGGFADRRRRSRSYCGGDQWSRTREGAPKGPSRWNGCA